MNSTNTTSVFQAFVCFPFTHKPMHRSLMSKNSFGSCAYSCVRPGDRGRVWNCHGVTASSVSKLVAFLYKVYTLSSFYILARTGKINLQLLHLSLCVFDRSSIEPHIA